MSVAGEGERSPRSLDSAPGDAQRPRSVEHLVVAAGRLFGVALVAAALLAVLDVAALSLFVGAAYSNLPGLVALLVWTTLIFLVVAVPLASIARFGMRRLSGRLPILDAALVTSVALTALTIVVALAGLASVLATGDIEFPERVELARRVFELGLVVGLLAVGRWGVWPLVRTVFVHAPRFANPRAIGAIWLLLAVCLLAVSAAWGLAPIHLVQPAALCGLAALALAVVGCDLVLPSPSRRGALGWLVLAGIAVVMGVGGQRSRHARFLLFSHSPMARGVAEAIRDVVDFDDDGASPTWLLGQDCAEWDPHRGPALLEIRGDGIDQDCRGGDAPPQPPLEALSSPWSACSAAVAPSVLFITIDAMRADALGPRLTPHLSRLAQQGQWFTRAYSPSGLTGVTFASLFTGYPPSSLAPNLLRARELNLPVTLAERLRRRGYRTAVINYLKLDPGLLSGFELVNRQQQVDLHPDSVKVHLASAAVTNGAIEYVNHGQSRPYFLALHYPDLHAPYLRPPDRRFAEGEVTNYERSLAYTDHHVGRLLTNLHASGALGRTVVIVTADHGESLGQRGHEGHGINVFDEVIHVPLLSWVPGCPARQFDEPVSVMHLGGWLTEMAGASAAEAGPTGPGQGDPVVSEASMTSTGVYLRSVVWGHHKLMVDVRSGGRLLFDLEADPGETVNLHSAQPDVAEQLESVYQSWLDRRPLPVE